jgi:hypothetical protein
LAALRWVRQTEITDGLVELLTGLIHRINARAERRVEKELIGGLAPMQGKKGIYSKLVNAALDKPDETVRQAVWPAVPGGEATLRKLARELMATERAWRERVRVSLRGSYTHYYRRMLAPLLGALRFKCNNTAFRPVMDAIGLLARYKDISADQKHFAKGEKVPMGVVPKAWMEAVTTVDGRVERVPYELCVLIALREALRRREVWVEGAGRWRDPDEDLPGDFDDNRDVHYAAIKKPLNAKEFTADLRNRHRTALDRLDTAMAQGTTGGVRVRTRDGQPWISVPKLEKLPEPKNLAALKAEVARRWGTIDLLDILKDADFLTDFTDEFESVATARPCRGRCCAAGCFWRCSRWARTWASGKWPPPASTRKTRVRYGGRGPATSPATTCAGPLCGWSTPPSRPATPSGGARRPRRPAIRSGSGRGSRT